jgi:hypothetical protein
MGPESGGREVGTSLSSKQLTPATSGVNERSIHEAQTNFDPTVVPGGWK